MEDIEKNRGTENKYSNLVTGKILLVESDIVHKKLISLYIRIAGAEVDIAVNAEDAIELSIQNNYDLIFMDINMPVIGNMETIRVLKSKKNSIPAIVLTANSFLDVTEKISSNQYSDFLTKPIDIDRLHDVLRQYLKFSSDEIIPLRSSLLANEPELYDLIKKYINKYPGMIKKLKVAFNESDLNAFDMLLHDMKSTGGNYGFMLITDLTVLIKAYLKSNDVKAISSLLDELELLHQRMVLAL